MSTTNDSDLDPEIAAITQVYAALRSLETPAQHRVLDYVLQKIGITLVSGQPQSAPPSNGGRWESDDREAPGERVVDDDATDLSEDDALDGVSPAAKKWIRRNSFATGQLSKVFSLGVDEIDLVAKKIPGTSMRDRARSVILLKGIASYLSTGVPRVTYEQIKETCQHYGAFDSPNFAKYLKTMASSVSGTKESGFSLTARGLTEATEMVRGMV